MKTTRLGNTIGLRGFLILLGLLLAACGTAGEPAVEAPPAEQDRTEDPTPAPDETDPFRLASRYESGSPSELARRLVRAERAIRSDDTPAAELAEHGRIQQAAYRQLIGNEEWREEALASIPADLHPVVHAHIEAGSELQALTAPRPALPDWQIIEPRPAEELLGYYREAEQEFGVGWEYLAAINLVETRMGRILGTSHAGAQGPMQFMPPTWAAYGEGDINDPRDSIRSAARYLRAMGAPGNMDRALYRYNPSDLYVRAISLYAEQMRADPRVYRGYYHWEVYFRTVDGNALLYPGWSQQGD